MMNPTDDFLPADLSAMIDAELAKGERLDWIGRPIPWLRARSSLGSTVFGLLFTGFAFYWVSSAGGFGGRGGFPRPPGGGAFALVGIPFVLVGLGMTLSPLGMFYKAMHTAYAITDRRALTIERNLLGRVVVRSFSPESLATITRNQHADGSGDLVFRREYRPSGRRGQFIDIGFLGVPDVKAVEDRIRDLVHRGDGPR